MKNVQLIKAGSYHNPGLNFIIEAGQVLPVSDEIAAELEKTKDFIIVDIPEDNGKIEDKKSKGGK